jgi:hypothetical protein
MHFKAHAFEHNFCPGVYGDLFEKIGNLGSIEGGRRHQNIELNRQKPERCHIRLASLIEKKIVRGTSDMKQGDIPVA